MSEPREADRAARHKMRMARKKAHIDNKIANADSDRGVVLVLTGNGKGKSSSGFGMLARALGHGMRVAVVQFIKGSSTTGEEAFFRAISGVRYHVMGEGFTWETQDDQRDAQAARAAWQLACELMSDRSVDVLLLDELNIALKNRYLPVESVISALAARPAMQHVIITGRGAPKALIDVSDTVTEMAAVKHAFTDGVRAQKGIEL